MRTWHNTTTGESGPCLKERAAASTTAAVAQVAHRAEGYGLDIDDADAQAYLEEQERERAEVIIVWIVAAFVAVALLAIWLMGRANGGLPV